jgi:hypothetical protein
MYDQLVRDSSPLQCNKVKLVFEKQKSKGIKEDESILCSTPEEEEIDKTPLIRKRGFSPMMMRGDESGPAISDLGESFMIKLRNMNKNTN